MNTSILPVSNPEGPTQAPMSAELKEYSQSEIAERARRYFLKMSFIRQHEAALSIALFGEE